jgi:hypothetical protein
MHTDTYDNVIEIPANTANRVTCNSGYCVTIKNSAIVKKIPQIAAVDTIAAICFLISFQESALPAFCDRVTTLYISNPSAINNNTYMDILRKEYDPVFNIFETFAGVDDDIALSFNWNF